MPELYDQDLPETTQESNGCMMMIGLLVIVAGLGVAAGLIYVLMVIA